MGLLASKSPTPGPYRPASKGGVYVGMLEFPDIYARFNSLFANPCNTDTKTCTVAGYTLAVQCRLTKDKSGSSTVLFVVYLIDGPWDNNVEWPFGRTINLTLVHPSNYTKDMSWSIPLDQKGMVRKPEPGRGNACACSGPVKWDHLDSVGFVVNKSLYVHIELK
ncbi:hypothetical protein HPB51_017172 [Rhipicephalus microplus]|uniref:TRAF1-6 MATH domain-containing protein n=1 Tax=Rhipicephalus microplus TaxID=6941 RepID=A0A9J6EBD2_RHIMP|nr:hypothetical protein HPB51_017172 [Rhipicephalus microplus]